MILVTGATGFVGSSLVKTLSEGGEDIRCLIRSGSQKIPAPNRNIEIIKGDICDKDTVNAVLRGVSRVVHLAAVIQDSDPRMIRKVNVEGTKNLVQSSLQYGIEHFIFFSTLNVILPVKNKYSESKLEAEDIIQGSGLNFTILRPSIIYGQGDNGAISKFISSVKNRKIILILGDGKYKLQPVYIGDVVKAVCVALNAPTGFKNKIFYLVGRDTVSYNGLIKLISDVAGIKGRTLHLPLSIIKVMVDLISVFYKRGIQLSDRIKTYPFDKVVDGALQKDIFPINTCSLKDGLLILIKTNPKY